MDTSSQFERTVLSILKEDIEKTTSARHHLSLDVLLDYLNGALPLQERALVDAHTLRCPHCRQRLEALAEGVANRVRDLCGQAPAWSFATWLAQRGQSTGRVTRPFWRSAKLVWALGSATAAICLGVATWDMLTPESRWVARGESSGGLPTLALVLFAVAGALAATGALMLILRRKQR